MLMENYGPEGAAACILKIKRQSQTLICKASRQFLEYCPEFLLDTFLSRRSFAWVAFAKNWKVSGVTNAIGLRTSWHLKSCGDEYIRTPEPDSRLCARSKGTSAPRAPVNHQHCGAARGGSILFPVGYAISYCPEMPKGRRPQWNSNSTEF